MQTICLEAFFERKVFSFSLDKVVNLIKQLSLDRILEKLFS